MSKSQSKVKTSVVEKSCRGADLASTSKQRFREEILHKENMSRVKLYMGLREARNDESAPASRQYEVFKGKVERSLLQPLDSLLELADKHQSSEHQHKIQKVDSEKMALKRVEDIVLDGSREKANNIDDIPFSMSSNSEYGWWVGSQKEGEVGRIGGKGRKNIIKETFYRRNGVESCMAV